MRFIAKSPSAAPKPSRRGLRERPLSCHCADLALVYGKGSRLSPIRRVFWAFSTPGLGPPEVRPPRPRQGLGLGLPPGRDPGVVAGQQDFRDRLALELLRTGILRVFQEAVGKAFVGPGDEFSHYR